MIRTFRNILLFCLLALTSGLSLAEMVKIPVGQQAPELRDMNVPKRGMTKEEVEAGFGTPLERNPAVGEPPISSWEFEHYFVYFEKDRVLHTVFKPTKK